MENMEKLLNFLYQKFILRDLLSIFSNGLISFYSLYITFSNFICFNKIKTQFDLLKIDDFLKYFYYILLITFIYAIGLIINFIRDFSYFLIFYNEKENKWYHFIKKHNNIIREYYKIKINIDQDKKNKDYFQSNNDRSVIIFQTLGNLGISLFIFSFTQLQELETFIIFLILSILMIIISIGAFKYHKILNEVMSNKK